MKIVKKIQLKIVIFTAVKNGSVLHGRVFVVIILMNNNFSAEQSTDNINYNLSYAVAVIQWITLCHK